MKGLSQLVLGLFATFAFSWIGLALIPNAQIGHLDPQMDEEGTDIYPMPPSGMAVRGRKVYTANGCFYCHSQQVRPAYVAADIERKWGNRRSAPRDYVFNRPDLLGRMRMGPDLANIGQRAPAEDENDPGPGASPAASPAAAGAKPAAAASPAAPPASPGPSPARDSGTKPGEPATYSAAWHHHHLYSPRMVDVDSNMPAYRFLYEKRRISGERSADALNLTGADAPPDGYEIVPSYEAKCLVAYLMSLNQSHPLKEVKPLGFAPATSPSPAAPGKGTGK
jgi:cytochrome c oxidase cbb3-type subunit 2